MSEILRQNAFEQSIHILKKEGQEGKVGTVQGWVPVRGGRASDKGEGGRIWWLYFLFMYENSTMRPVEIVLRWGRRKKENNLRVKSEIYCQHMCTCHNESPMYNNYMLIKIK
jgi:hypothetical protein